MKKICKLILLLIVLSFAIIPTFAEESKDNNDFLGASTTEELYDKYMEAHGVTGREDLSATENNELSLLIERFKYESLGLEPARNTRTHLSSFTGAIFIHFDNTIHYGWNHGHVAIGRGLGCIEIQNENSVVEEYGAQRIEYWYSKQSGGLYTVRNANATHNQQAADSAYNKLGTGYWVTGSLFGYTCSGLVATAWNDTSLGTLFPGGNLIIPNDFATSTHTVLQFLWADVEY